MNSKHRKNRHPSTKASTQLPSHPQASSDGIPDGSSNAILEAGEFLSVPPRTIDAYKALVASPQLAEMLHRHIKPILELVNQQRSDDAASVVMDAAVKAIVDFDPVRAEWAWVTRNVKWALQTVSRMRRPSAVRDAYTAYLRDKQKGPTLKQLAKAAGLTTREVLAVWHLVAEELKIGAREDTVIGSLPSYINSSLQSSLNFESIHQFFVLSKHLDPLSYALVLLSHLIGRTGNEIRQFAGTLQQWHAQGRSKKGLEDEIDSFAGRFGKLLGLEWTDEWLKVRTNQQIRVRIHRAKKVLREERDSGSSQHFAA